ncbi:MAG: fibronectin type III domain-containing protein [bacterium]
MSKYIPWIVGGIVVVSVCITAYLLFRPVGEEDTQGENTNTEELETITPNNMQTSNVSSSSFTVTWETKENSAGFVKYGNTSNSLSLIAQDVNGTKPRTSHKVVVSGLSAGRKYYFFVMSENVAFGKEGRALEVLTTSDL